MERRSQRDSRGLGSDCDRTRHFRFPIFDIDSNNTSGADFVNANGSSLIRPNMTCNPALSNPTLAAVVQYILLLAARGGSLAMRRARCRLLARIL